MEVLTFTISQSACIQDLSTAGAIVAYDSVALRLKTWRIGCVLRELHTTAFHVSSLTLER
jgi:hypothetical protein